MKNYFYDYSSRMGMQLCNVSVQYYDATECYSLKVVSGENSAYLEVYPEELAELYEGNMCDYLGHRIRITLSEIKEK